MIRRLCGFSRRERHGGEVGIAEKTSTSCDILGRVGEPRGYNIGGGAPRISRDEKKL